MRPAILTTLLSVAFLYISSPAEQGSDTDGRWLSNGYFLARNMQAVLPDTPFYDPRWPIITDWGPEVYVSDTTWWFYDPRIAVGDTLSHIFGEGNFQPIHYRSHDNGLTWEFWANYRDSTSDGSAGIVNAYCEGSKLFATWGGQRGNDWSFIIFRSSIDGGETWPVRAELRVDPVWAGAVKSNVSGHEDTAFVSFTEGWGFDSLACWRTTNLGTTWTNRGFIANSWGASYPPSICYAAGVVHIAFQKDWDHQNDIFYMRSTDHGQTWSEPVLLGFDDQNHGQWPELWSDSLGNVAVCWMDYHGSPYAWTGGIWCRVSHDYGQSWPGLYLLNDDYLGYVGTTVVVDGDYLALAWVSSNSPPIVHVRESSDGGESWGNDQAVAQGSCYAPRLAKKGTDLYLIWRETEYIRPDFYVDFIKFMRNDLRVGISSPEISIEDEAGIGLSVYPNPFNLSATITLDGVEGGDKEITIYDVRAALVKSICLGKEEQKATWDATDNAGQKVCSGLYFARVETPQGEATTKLLLVR